MSARRNLLVPVGIVALLVVLAGSRYLRSPALTGQVIGGPTTQYVTTPFDKIPNYGQNPTKTAAVTTGNWSSANSWVPAGVPGPSDVVMIPAGKTITIDTTTAIANNIGVEGTLTFSRSANTKLQVTTIIVYPVGTFDMGSAASPIPANINAELVFRDSPINTTSATAPYFDPMQYGHSLIGLGKVTSNGATKTPFVRTAVEPVAGATTLTLVSPVSGWNVGDEIFLPDTRQTPSGQWFNTNYALQNEARTITNISANGTVITLSSPLTFSHLGARNADSTQATFANGTKVLPHVGNTSRNVIMRSENPGGTRGQLFMTYRADVHIVNTQVTDMGRTLAIALDSTTYDAAGNVTHVGTNQIGRYALHAHHLWGPVNPSNTGYQFEFVGNALRSSMKWPITIHDSHFGLIKDNVLYDQPGAGIVMEDQSVSDNLFDHNYVANTLGHVEPRTSGENPAFPGTAGECFWSVGFNNRFTNNVTAACRNTEQNIASGVGYKFIVGPAASPVYSTRQPARRGGDLVNGVLNTDYILAAPSHQPIKEFDGNEAYGLMADGITIWNLGGADNSYPVARTTLKNFTVWNAFEGVLLNYPMNSVTFDGLYQRVDPASVSNNSGVPSTIVSVDYFNSDMIMKNADIHARSIIGGATAGAGYMRIENSKATVMHGVFSVVRATPGGGGAPPVPFKLIVDNTKINAWPGKPLSTIYMDYPSQGNPTTGAGYAMYTGLYMSVKTFACNYQQQPGNNFQVFWKEQAPGAPFPQTQAQASPYKMFITLTACPSSGMTNAQCLATHGFATAGELAPCADQTSHPEVTGYTCVTPATQFVCSGATNAPPVPVINNGQASLSVTLPNTVTLNGTVTDAGGFQGGTPSLTWQFGNFYRVGNDPYDGVPTFSQTTGPQTVVSFPQRGTYNIVLEASDGLDYGRDTITVYVSDPSSSTSSSSTPTSSSSSSSSVPTSSSSSSSTTPSSSSSSSVHPSAPGAPPILNWTFNETSGTVAHETINTADGTLVNSPSWTAGKVAGAIDFNGTTSYVSVPATNFPNFLGGTFSMSFWMKRTTTTSNNTNTIVDFNGASTATGGFQFYVRADGSIVFGSPGNAVGQTAAGAVPSGQWAHVAMVHSPASGGNQIFVNGVAQTLTTNAAASFTQNANAKLIGIRKTDTYSSPANGTLDDLCFWDRDLDPSEVSALYNGGTGASCVSTVTSSSSSSSVSSVSSSSSSSVSSSSSSVANVLPTADAGPDQSVILPATVTLAGSATDDGQPIPPGALTYTWITMGGPAAVQYANANDPHTTATFLVPGTYTLLLRVHDGSTNAVGNPNTVSDTMTVTVNAVNLAPVVSAGANQTVTLPATATIAGTATDVDHQPNPPGAMTIGWSMVSGPGTATFTPANTPNTVASFTTPGTYVLRLTASDGALTSTSDVTITAIQGNVAPTVDAGPDQTVRIPATATLSVSVTDDGLPAGSTLTRTWATISGPSTPTVSGTNAPVFATVTGNTASFPQAGTYVLRLTASDGALNASDDVTVIVQPSLPCANFPTILDEFNSFRMAFNMPNGPLHDYDGDGWVSFSDFSILRNSVCAQAPQSSSSSSSSSVVSCPPLGPQPANPPNQTCTWNVMTQPNGCQAWDGVCTNNSSSSFSSAPSTTGGLPSLVAYWPFDESSGTTATDVVGSKNGTLVNGPTWTSGKIGGAVSFGGTNSHITLPSNIPALGNNFTVSFWVKPQSCSVNQQILGFDNAQNQNGLEVVAPYSNNCSIQLGSRAFVTAFTNPNAVTPGQWNHVVITKNGTTANVSKIYVNGVAQPLLANAAYAYQDLNTAKFIGVRTSILDRHFTGEIDDLALWNTALTDAQVASLYSNGNGQASNLISLAPAAPASWFEHFMASLFNALTGWLK